MGKFKCLFTMLLVRHPLSWIFPVVSQLQRVLQFVVHFWTISNHTAFYEFSQLKRDFTAKLSNGKTALSLIFMFLESNPMA